MNTSDTRWPDQRHLNADFAARVLRRADTIRARRRRVQSAMAAAAAVLLVVLFVGPRVAPTATSELSVRTAADFDPGFDSLSIFDAALSSSSGGWSLDSAPDQNADALTYLFPDAAPLARFVDEYSAVTHGIGMGNEAVSSEDTTIRGELL